MSNKADSTQLTLIIFCSCFFLLIAFVLIYEPSLTLLKPKKSSQPDFSFEDVTVTYIYDGELKWELESEYAELDKASDRVFMTEAVGDIFSDGKKSVAFEAPEARLTLGNSDMELSDSVAEFFINEKSVYLKSKILNWFSEKNIFVGQHKVELSSEGMTLKGKYLTVDVDTKKMKMTKDAKAVLSAGTQQ